MRRLITTLVVCAMFLVPTGAGATSSEGPVHLALGDSVAFGIGAARPEQHGYVPVLNRWAHAFDCRDGLPAGCPRLELVNISVPGATSSSLIANQLQPAVDLIAARNNDGDPGNDVTLITIDIGGNDLFNPVVGACSGGVTAQCAAVIEAAFNTFATNLGLIMGTLRTVAGPETEIAIMTYYNPLGACFLAALEPLGDLVLEGGGPVPVGFNDIIRAVSAATGATVVDTFGRLDNDDFVGGQDCLHPNKSGHHKVAEVFRETLR